MDAKGKLICQINKFQNHAPNAIKAAIAWVESLDSAQAICIESVQKGLATVTFRFKNSENVMLFHADGSWNIIIRGKGDQPSSISTAALFCWLPVTDGLPLQGRDVLTCDEEGAVQNGYFSGGYNDEKGPVWYSELFDHAAELNKVTHYMPLPKPPNKASKKRH